MATNLVSQIMDFLTPDIISKIAGYFGLDRYSTQKAIGASVPAVLAGLVGLASKPEGAKQLSNVLSQQPSGPLDNLRSLTSGTEQRTVAENGAGLLSSLFGGSVFNTVAGAVGKYAGIGEGTSKSLLGMLAPLVLGSVAQQQRQSGLDANGLSSFLASQKDNVMAAMPSGFGNMLSGTGIMESLGDSWRGTSAAASAAAGRFANSANEATADVRRAAQYAARDTTRAASSGWLPWALGLLVLAGLAWWLTSQPGTRVESDDGDDVAEPHRGRCEHLRPDHLGDQQREVRDPGHHRPGDRPGRFAEASAGRRTARQRERSCGAAPEQRTQCARHARGIGDSRTRSGLQHRLGAAGDRSGGGPRNQRLAHEAQRARTGLIVVNLAGPGVPLGPASFPLTATEIHREQAIAVFDPRAEARAFAVQDRGESLGVCRCLRARPVCGAIGSDTGTDRCIAPLAGEKSANAIVPTFGENAAHSGRTGRPS